MGKVGMAELHGLGVKQCLGGGVNDVKAAVVLEGRTDVEAATATEVPGVVVVDQVVDEDPATGRAKGDGVKVEGPVVVFIGGDERVDSHMRLSVSLVYGRSLSQRKFGNLWSMPARMFRK